MSQSIIRQLLESRLKTWADAEPIQVAWENVNFDPPSASYLKAYVIPAPTTSDDLKGDHRNYTGVFQVSVVGMKGNSAIPVEAIAEDIAALYPVNLQLTSGGVTVQIITPMSIAQAIQEPDRYTIPVSCTYRADTI